MKEIVEKINSNYGLQKQWFVFRATYGRERKAYEIISHDSTEVYLPMHTVLKTIDEKKTHVREPLLPNIIFVHCNEMQAVDYVKRSPKLSGFLRFYYNHLRTNPDGTNPPLIIDDLSMRNFIKVTSVDNEHLRIVNPTQCHYKNGDIVRVTQGAFSGVEGRVARILGQQRVVVELDGLCAIATAYIPSGFIEKR